jgi:hypothetical protein
LIIRAEVDDATGTVILGSSNLEIPAIDVTPAVLFSRKIPALTLVNPV